MSLMSFFCRLMNGKCAQEPREREGESYPQTPPTASSSAPYPPQPPPRTTQAKPDPGTTGSLG
jgi:hypothetical protein